MRCFWPAVLLTLAAIGGVQADQPAPSPKYLTLDDLERWFLEKIQPPGPNPRPAPALKPDENHPVTLPAFIAVDVGRQASVEASTLLQKAGDPPLKLVWKAMARDKLDLGYRGCSAFITPRVAGEWEVDAITAYKGEVYVATLKVRAGPQPPEPGPSPPTPPGPAPGPTPPAPNPAPIPAAGFRVLIVYESADLSKMPAPQQAIIFSKTVRDYLNAKCVPGADAKTKEWRIFDKDTDVSAESTIWQAAMQRHPISLPWLIVSNGTTGFEGPLPADVESTMKVLQQFGG